MKRTLLIVALLMLIGCTAQTVTVKDVVLLPEDRIYTVPAGQKIAVTLDGKPLEMVFPTDMKLVHSSILVRQEQTLNDAILEKKHAEKKTAERTGILGTVLAIISSILAMVLKKKSDSDKK